MSPEGFRRFTGTPAAVGPPWWLIVVCRGAGPRPAGQDGSGQSRCVDVVINLQTGARRTLPGPPPDTAGISGVVVPDGLAAAVFRGTGSRVTLHLLNLASGAGRRLGVRLARGTPGPQTLAWSPDSRWLFVVAADGRLDAVNARTGQVQGLGLTLPPVGQIAVRTRRRLADSFLMAPAGTP